MEDVLVTGGKRKIPDNMILNDDGPMLDGVAKKVKCDTLYDTLMNQDISIVTVETEVGDGQLCPAL